jgi:hypothetical protein
MQLIYDVRAAVIHAQRILRPGGVLLATVPVASRLAPAYGLDRDYWRFTPAGCRRLFSDVFGPDRVEIRSYGNARTGAAFLWGLAREELTRRELETHDAYFPLIVAVRAVKRSDSGSRASGGDT